MMSLLHLNLRSFTILSFIALQYVAVVSGEIRTIDDTDGDSVTGATPTYSNEDCWNKGPDCSACTFQPDPSQAHYGTWHDTTSNVCNNAYVNGTSSHSVAFDFTGTSLTVYCIMISQGPTAELMNLTFTLDGETSTAAFPQSVSGATYGYQYNYSVFSQSSLSNTEHSFTMAAIQGTSASVLLFDYAQYTYEEQIASIMSPTPSTIPATSSSQTTSTQTSSTPSTSSSTTGTSTAPSSEQSSTPSSQPGSTVTSNGQVNSTAAQHHDVTTSASTSSSTTTVAANSKSGNDPPVNMSVVVGAAVGGSVAVIVILVVVVVLYVRCKKGARVRMSPPNTLRKSRYDTVFEDDGDGDGDGDEQHTPTPNKGKSPARNGVKFGSAPRRSRPVMILTDLRASHGSMPSSHRFNRDSEVSSAGLLGTLSAAGSLSAEVDARSVMRQSSGSNLRMGEESSGYGAETDVPPLPSSTESYPPPPTIEQSSKGGSTSTAERRNGTVWQTQLATLRSEMAEEIARLREQTEAITMVPPPAYM
ncbi:uncharacterized protein C8Q71DRAFT_199661 [Rhodofomes roseus]|uniref:Uncharacterized protein n=1 Tax=Rhodofomes roseus TaxID=34475 RepID=A0ABQ8KVM8_9APHY|nr:uncharacterized protein C8Q71DRAFT_199661 [Rhodofomes roseus]KAH9842350.1 hypothetical protein C8Q71DRAFT_199661 [Rhodofomes roseus]